MHTLHQLLLTVASLSASLLLAPITNATLYGIDTDGTLVRIDEATAALTPLGNVGFTGTVGLAHDPMTNTLWSAVGVGTIIQIDPATAAASTVLTVSNLSDTGIYDLAFTPSGALYLQTFTIGAGVDASIWSIDRSTGAATLVLAGMGEPGGLTGLSEATLLARAGNGAIDPSNPTLVLDGGFTGLPSTSTQMTLDRSSNKAAFVVDGCASCAGALYRVDLAAKTATQLTAVSALTGIAHRLEADAAAELRAWEEDFGDQHFAVISAIRESDGASSIPTEAVGCPRNLSSIPTTEPHTLFSQQLVAAPIGFVSGLASDGSTLWALDWDAGSGGVPVRLATIAVDPANGCLSGEDVDPNAAIGFQFLEALAYCPPPADALYTADFDGAGSHTGKLITIDKVTGIGSAVSGAAMGFDRKIVGMTCDASGTLWAVTNGNASASPELLTIDRSTGIETPIGLTGTSDSAAGSPVIEALAFDSQGQLLAAGSGLWRVDQATGAATPVAGRNYRNVWALANVPEPSAAALALAAITTLVSLRRRKSARPRALRAARAGR